MTASLPDKLYPAAGGYFTEYRGAMAQAWASVDTQAFDRAAAMLRDAVEDKRMLYACGNGGSTAVFHATS